MFVVIVTTDAEITAVLGPFDTKLEADDYVLTNFEWTEAASLAVHPVHEPAE